MNKKIDKIRTEGGAVQCTNYSTINKYNNNNNNNKINYQTKMESEWVDMPCMGAMPTASFGQTATILGKTKVVLFGGAVEVDGKLTMTDSIYVHSVYKNEWSKITSNSICVLLMNSTFK